MANSKSKAASKKKAPARSRSAAKSARKTKATSARTRDTGVVETARTAGDNQPGATLVNEKASAQAATLEDRQQLAEPKVAKVIEGALAGDPLTSLNSVPKAEGGLPHDELARLRQVQEAVTGQGALGQPGQKGHGVGTGTAGLAGVMSEEDAKKDHQAYLDRFK